MTRQFRIPGPLGRSPFGIGGRMPGPLRTLPGIYAAPNQIVKTAPTKKLKMPLPASTSTTKKVHDYSWNLFSADNKKNKVPALGDVEQGALANCPLASWLAALAYTPSGRSHILSLIEEHSPAAVETDLSGVASDLDSPPDGNKITSNRYFTVRLGGKSFEVSAVLYTDDADRNWSLIFMRSPTSVLWPCLIEKAFAVKVSGYNEVDNVNANDTWEVLTGKKPGGFEVNAGTTDAKIREAAKNASKIPTIAASADDIDEEAAGVASWHGFAVLGMSGSKIELYDPSAVERKLLSLNEFRKNFKAVLHGSH